MKVFISRNLSPESAFAKRMQAAKIEVIAQSLIHFKAHSFDFPKDADWIFFYSKTGVQYFFMAYNVLIIKASIGCIGKGTADYLRKQYGFAASFIGNGDPQATAATFQPLAKGKKVAFIRALDSKKSVQQILANQIEIIDCIAYENSPNPENINLSDASVLVFTSPMNAQTYFARNELTPNQKIVTIGVSTAAALETLGIFSYTIAASPNEDSLADAVLKLIV